VGRAPGPDLLTAHALNAHSDAAAGFPRQVRDLEAWVGGRELDDGHPFAAIRAHPTGPTERDAILRLRAKAIAGTAGAVAQRLRVLAASLDLDELVIVTWTHDPAARLASYELIAREFDLWAQTP
jgi:hypothetical protein